MLRAADEAVILADSTKFGRQSLALLCELNEVTQVVVDNEVTADWRSRISATGTAVLVAGLTDNG
jgi:DeoR/GlpR family transcriptional regulator of sugar metabolism